VYLRSPGSSPSPESASILLFDAVAPAGTLEEQLVALVKQSCDGAKVTKQGKPVAVKTVGFSGLTISVTLQVPGDRRARDELRVFTLVDAGNERLPVAFIGGGKSLPSHQHALDEMITSIGPLVLAPELYRRWVE
jgi:hypothetical protein